MRALPTLALAALLFAFAAAPASAYWLAGGAGFGWATAQTLGGGVQPTGSAIADSVTVAWTQTPFAASVLGAFGGGGYVVKRYPGSGGPAVTPNAGCASTVSGVAAVLTCVESGVAPGYWQYTVTPVLISWTGAESTRSGAVPVAPEAPALAPAAAQNPAPGQAVGDIQLTWGASPGATGYNVYRRTLSGFFDFSSPLNGAVPLSATTYVDPGAGLTAATTYVYVVRAVTDGISSRSSTARTVTPYARPPAPATVTATRAPAAAIGVSWPGVGGVAGYAVYRRTPPGSYNYGAPLNGVTLVTATSYSDASSVNATSYRYVVRSAVAGAGGVPIESFDSAESATVTADGIAPTAVTIADPGAFLRGTVTLSGTASDSGSGVASVRFQYRPASGPTWADACVDAVAPYTCALNTLAIADGLYDLRAVAADVAGNVTASSVVASRRIDNTAPTVSVADPGAFVRATITLTATAADAGSGLASVLVQIAPTGTGTWANVCTVASCSLNTTLYADGGYDLRAIATDAAGNATTSATVANRVIDNTPPIGTDVQATNVAGGTAAKPETGDVLTYTCSEPLLASSILAGWSGAATPVVARFTEGNPDLVTVYDATNTVQLALGSVDIGKRYVNASMTFTGSIAVLSGSTITITLGTPTGPTQKATGTSKLEWTTSTAATDRAGNPVVAAAVAESGAGDLDF